MPKPTAASSVNRGSTGLFPWPVPSPLKATIPSGPNCASSTLKNRSSPSPPGHPHEPQDQSGIELNPQKDLLPVLGLDGKDVTKHFFLDFLSETCRCLPEAILSYELTVYPAESGCRLGWHDEFVSSPRLDNLTSVLASLLALVAPTKPTV